MSSIVLKTLCSYFEVLKLIKLLNMSTKKRSAAAVDETAAPATNETVTLEKVENNLARGPDFKALSAVEAFVSINTFN